jgi:hypothetical protein
VSRRSLYLLVCLAFAIHNGEEALAAPRLLEFMQSRAPGFLRDFYAAITVSELRANLFMLTALGLVVTAIAARTPAATASAFAILVFGAVLGLNAVAHIALTIAFRTYMPGVVTAVSITLPVSAVLLRRARREAWVSTPVFWAVIPIAALVHGPVLGVFLRSTIAILRMWTRSGVA